MHYNYKPNAKPMSIVCILDKQQNRRQDSCTKFTFLETDKHIAVVAAEISLTSLFHHQFGLMRENRSKSVKKKTLRSKHVMRKHLLKRLFSGVNTS